MNEDTYETEVQRLESLGLTRSDAQAVVDAMILIKERENNNVSN